MKEVEDDLVLASYLYLDVAVDFQGDGLERGHVDVDLQIPPVPGLLVFVLGEVVAQAAAQAQPRGGGASGAAAEPCRLGSSPPMLESRALPLCSPFSCPSPSFLGHRNAHRGLAGRRGSSKERLQNRSCL